MAKPGYIIRDLFSSQFWRLKIQDQVVPYDRAMVRVS
jgi:hypothetical protein